MLATARTHTALADLEKQHPDRVAVLTGDMADTSLAQRTVDLAMQRFARIDGLIVNHGTLDPIDRMRDANVEDWKKAFDVNVFGVVALVGACLQFRVAASWLMFEQLQAALRPLRESKGTIVLTSSGAAVKGTATWGAYNASKAVINSFARTIAAEEPHVAVVAIRPGVVDTEMQNTLRDEHFGKMDQEDVERFVHMRSQGQMLKPEQPGNVMARLVLQKPSGMSGEFLK